MIERITHRTIETDADYTRLRLAVLVQGAAIVAVALALLSFAA